MTLRLNLGAGEHNIPGFVPLDRKYGDEVYPLAYEDGSVDEIRASHVLEHFSHRDTLLVLQEWVRVLAPGGLLRVAVPDFQWVAEQYLAGSQIPAEGYVMGGHVDEDDRHGALFDDETLAAHMRTAGLLGISRWHSEIEDCASLPVSLNLQGWKPPEKWPKVSAVTSVPRLGFTQMRTCIQQALWPLGIPVRDVEGAYWGQCLTRGIEIALTEDDPEWVLTVDYDSVFDRHDVESLLSAAARHPEADAIAAVQAHRYDPRQLFVLLGDDGKPSGEVEMGRLRDELLPAATAHFGLTLLRAEALRRLPHPWFHGTPGADGRWGDDRLDDDVGFWRRFRAAGLHAYIATRVAIGHLELTVRWPDRQLGVMHQAPKDYQAKGKPEGAWR